MLPLDKSKTSRISPTKLTTGTSNEDRSEPSVAAGTVPVKEGEDRSGVLCQVESSEDLSKNKKLKQFCPKWLCVDILKDWVAPHDDAFKAKCIACNKVLNAGKSELVKHAAGRKHARNMQLMQTSGVDHLEEIDEQQPQSTQEQLSTVLGSTGDEHQEMACNESSINSETQTNFEGIETSKLLQNDKKLAVLMRIASAMERIADSLEATTSFQTRNSPST